MKPALLLIDLQNDFLGRAGLTPHADQVVQRSAQLLEACRATHIPVLHIHTSVQPDGSNRMPHWRETDTWACVAGTPGCQPPVQLAPKAHEPIFTKSFYSAFEDASLEKQLLQLGADTLIVCGLYLHACVRNSVLDAYRRGYRVWVAADAVGSPDPLHADITRSYLQERTIRFLDSADILEQLTAPDRPVRAPNVDALPVGWIGGAWSPHRGHRLWEHRNPARHDQTLAWVPLARDGDADRTMDGALQAQAAWRKTSMAERQALLGAWAEEILARENELASSLVTEIGKPLAEARGEIRRAVAHIRTALDCFKSGERDVQPGGTTHVRHCPRGLVALVTPWNNPLSIPVGKLAPALLFGNSVVWKPALQAPRTAMLLMDTLHGAGLPTNVVSMLFGDAESVRRIVTDHRVAAVSLTGSNETGRQVAALCARRMKPLQAELGGNNAAIVMGHNNPAQLAEALARSAFGFSGQRCTATRRFIVEASIHDDLVEALSAAIANLRLGEPSDPLTQIGPLVSRAHQEKVGRVVREAVDTGARLVCGGRVPAEWAHGCWFEPTLLLCNSPQNPVIQQETFGPVAIIQPARDIEQALDLCNGVEQGLVASLYSHDPATQRRFLDEAQAGILRLNQTDFEIDPHAPFGGWKSSGLGPPEHGRWDAEFYQRPQAVYAPSAPLGMPATANTHCTSMCIARPKSAREES